MRRLYRGYFTTAILMIAVSVCICFYSAEEIWINAHDGRTGLCQAWLCPDEFAAAPIFAWHPDARPQSLPGDIEKYKRALKFDPASAYRWADLAERLTAAHRDDDARYCFEQAVKQAPRSPEILFRAANFYLSAGDSQRAIRNLYPILQDSDLYMYQKPAYMIYEQMGLPLADILDGGIPPTPYAARGFLHFLMGEHQVPDAQQTWSWMVSRSLADSRTAADYIDFLLQNGENLNAATEWAATNREAAPEYRRETWIYNGSFEQTPQPSLLDWHAEGIKNVRVSRTKMAATPAGAWCLEMAFNGQENVDYRQTYQRTVLAEGRWRLSALVKTQSLTTDQGISLHVFDPEDAKRLDVRTDTIKGTHDWTPLAAEFDVGPGTSLVEVQIMRAASQQFDNKIDGRAWIDSVQLSPVH